MAKSIRSKIKRKYRAVKAKAYAEIEKERVEKRFENLQEVINQGGANMETEGAAGAKKPFTFTAPKDGDIDMVKASTQKKKDALKVKKVIRKGQKAVKPLVWNKKKTKSQKGKMGAR